MKTVRLTESLQDLKTAADLLKGGKTVAIPTETVYGLAADATNESAVKDVFSAKGRPQDNPLIVHISDKEMLSFVADESDSRIKPIIEKFWPGPLTLVLPRSENIPASVSAGLPTVAVRMPENEIARQIIRLAGVPLAAPSANVSGSPSPTTFSRVLEDLDGKIDAVVMSGVCSVGVESTVVSLVASPPRLLRPGGITAEQLYEFLPDMIIDKAVLSEPEKDRPVASPGMKYKHYSPKTRIVLVDAEREVFKAFLQDKTDCGAICFLEDKELSCPFIVYGSEEDDASLAAGVFEALRKADELSKSVIYVHAPKKTGIGLAVYNRLVRAAAFEVVEL